jgi:tRNA pseudouridine32 synthase / 23S rRNA pseudouridine746 synthase
VSYFRKRKEYQAIVRGELKAGSTDTIKLPLDDKEAVTHYSVVESKNNMSLLHIVIDTGRLHQIRRHLDAIGFPIMGDPKYGKGNKNKDGLKLVASTLTFDDPWAKKNQHFSYPSNVSLSKSV